MEQKKDGRIEIRIPVDLIKWMHSFAKSHNTTVSAILRDYMEFIRENYDYRRCGNCAAYIPPGPGGRGKCLGQNILTEPDPDLDICKYWRPKSGILSRLERPKLY